MYVWVQSNPAMYIKNMLTKTRFLPYARVGKDIYWQRGKTDHGC